MKAILIALFTLLTVAAEAQPVSLNLASQTYLAGETVQLEIFTQDLEVEPKASNIKLVDETSKQIRIAPLFNKIEKNHYYAYFDLPLSLAEGNYTIILDNLRFKINNVLKEVSSEIKFEVRLGTPIITIKPALFIADKSSRELEIRVTSKDTTQLKLETSNFIKHPYEREEVLTAATTRIFYFNLDLKDLVYDTRGFINITYENESYSIPIFVSIGAKQEEPEIKALEFTTQTTKIERTLRRDEDVSGSLGIKNLLNKTLDDIYFELTGNLNEIIELNLTYKESLAPGEIVHESFLVNQEKNPDYNYYSGEFRVRSNGYAISLPITIEFEEVLEEPTPQPKIEEEPKKQQEELFQLPPPIPFEREEPSKVGLYMTILVIVILAAIIYKLSRKEKEKKTFKEYISTIKR